MEQRAAAPSALGRAVRPAAHAEAVQPAHRPVRARRHHVEHLLGLVIDNAYLVLAAQALVAQFLETFKEFPPRQKAASFTIDQVMEKMENAASGAHG